MMKRKNVRVPGFDEIIFRDRNKEYGAYDLREGYNKTLGISLLIGVALAVILVVLPSMTTKKGSAHPPTEIVVVMPDPDLEKALQLPPKEKKLPDENIDRRRLLVPEVANPGEQITGDLQPNDELINEIEDGVPTEIPDGTIIDAGPEIPPEPKPYITVQEMPEFPGGEMALIKFIADNLVYPEEAIENRVQGKIFIRFVVAPTGAVKEVEVIKSQGNALDMSILENEAVRVVKMLPLWSPGKQDGVPVPVYYNVPVIFTIR
jgi:periplasmic protein TonB